MKVSPGPYQPGQSVEVTITSVDAGGGVGNVRLFLNGKLVPRERLVSERDDKANNAKVHEAVYRVPLITGNNGFEAVAADEQGIDGMEATALVPTPGSKPLPTLHIVTIGINKYKDFRTISTMARPTPWRCLRPSSARARPSSPGSSNIG